MNRHERRAERAREKAAGRRWAGMMPLDRKIMEFASEVVSGNEGDFLSSGLKPGCRGFDDALGRCLPRLGGMLGDGLGAFLAMLYEMSGEHRVGTDASGQDWYVTLVGVPAVGLLADIEAMVAGPDQASAFARTFRGLLCPPECSVVAQGAIDLVDAASITPERLARTAEVVGDAFRTQPGGSPEWSGMVAAGMSLLKLGEYRTPKDGEVGARMLLVAITHRDRDLIVLDDPYDDEDDDEPASEVMLEEWLGRMQAVAGDKEISFGSPAAVALATASMASMLLMFEVELQRKFHGIGPDESARAVHVAEDPGSGTIRLVLEFGSGLVGPMTTVTTPLLADMLSDTVLVLADEVVIHEDPETLPVPRAD